jgi:glycosyltransferase involved in cell wall biosynthesis
MREHICIISYELYPPWNEGMKNTTRNLIEALRKYTDLDVSVISSCDRNCKLWVTPIYAKSPILLNTHISLLMHKLNKNKEVDIFHLCHASHTFFSFIAKEILKKPVIAQFFGGIRHRRLLRFFDTPNRVNAYITSSLDDIQSFPFNSKISQINPIINSDIFRPLDKTMAREYFNLPKDDFICAYIGNLHEQRLSFQLLDKIKEIAKERDNFKFLIITREGSPKLPPTIDNSEDMIVKTMNLSEEEKVLAYNAPDLFIFPFKRSVLYYNDGVVIDPPITMLEAMSCGKTVIASNVITIPYIVKDGVNGFLVEPDNLEGFKQKIIEVMELNYDIKKMEENARETIIRDFNPNKIAFEVKKVYEEVLKK